MHTAYVFLEKQERYLPDTPSYLEQCLILDCSYCRKLFVFLCVLVQYNSQCFIYYANRLHSGGHWM